MDEGAHGSPDAGGQGEAVAQIHQNDVYYHREDEYQRGCELDISPPHRVSETTSLPFEPHRVSLHSCGLINQQFQTITSL